MTVFSFPLFHRTRLDLFPLSSSQDIIQWDFDNCEAPLHMAALGAHVQVKEKETTVYLCQRKHSAFPISDSVYPSDRFPQMLTMLLDAGADVNRWGLLRV